MSINVYQYIYIYIYIPTCDMTPEWGHPKMPILFFRRRDETSFLRKRVQELTNRTHPICHTHKWVLFIFVYMGIYFIIYGNLSSYVYEKYIYPSWVYCIHMKMCLIDVLMWIMCFAICIWKYILYVCRYVYVYIYMYFFFDSIYWTYM